MGPHLTTPDQGNHREARWAGQSWSVSEHVTPTIDHPLLYWAQPISCQLVAINAAITLWIPIHGARWLVGYHSVSIAGAMADTMTGLYCLLGRRGGGVLHHAAP